MLPDNIACCNKMHAQTLDLNVDELLLLTLMLQQLIDSQNALLRSNPSQNDAEQARMRIEIATRLRGKLQMPTIEYGDADDDE